MLLSKGDNFSRYLDFNAATVGDEFWAVDHTSYRQSIKSIKHYVITSITGKFALCTSDDGDTLQIKMKTQQEDCYLENETYFQQLQINFKQSAQISALRRMVKDVDDSDFDPEFLRAFNAWAQRLENK